MSMLIDREGLQQVMEGYAVFKEKAAYYSLWQSATLKFWNPNDEEGEDILNQNLKILAAGGTAALFVLKFHPEFEGKQNTITTKTPICGSFNFRLNNPGAMQPMNGVQQANPTSDPYFKLYWDSKLEMMQMMHDMKVQELQDQLLATELDDEVDEEEDQLSRTLGTIGDIGEKHPWMQDILRDVVQVAKSFINQHIKRPEVNNTTAQHLAGMANETDPNKQVQEALQLLYTHDPNIAEHLVLLAKLAATDKDTYDLAIKKLKALV